MTGIVTAQMDPTNVIALHPPADRISSGAMTVNVFRVICSVVVPLNATTRPTKRLAMVLENICFLRNVIKNDPLKNKTKKKTKKN